MTFAYCGYPYRLRIDELTVTDAQVWYVRINDGSFYECLLLAGKCPKGTEHIACVASTGFTEEVVRSTFRERYPLIGARDTFSSWEEIPQPRRRLLITALTKHRMALLPSVAYTGKAEDALMWGGILAIPFLPLFAPVSQSAIAYHGLIVFLLLLTLLASLLALRAWAHSQTRYFEPSERP